MEQLVFCFKCGGVLRSTARSARIKACTCGADREYELRAHEGAPNHNLRSQAELEAEAAGMHAGWPPAGFYQAHPGLPVPPGPARTAGTLPRSHAAS